MKIIVPDMSCMHCKMTLEAALEKVKGIRSYSIDLETKTIDIEGDIDRETVAAVIKDAGYSVETAHVDGNEKT